MQDQTTSIEDMLRQLPAESRQEVRHFIEFLMAKQEARPRSQPQFDWAGALEELRDQYSSVDLQHQVTNWRSELE